MEKPGIFALTKQGTDFFAANRLLFWQEMKAILPIATIILMTTQAGGIFGYNAISLLMFFPMMVLQAHFAARWSKRSVGNDVVSGIDWKFVLSFIGLLLFAASPSMVFAGLVVFYAVQGLSIDLMTYIGVVRVATVITILMSFKMVFVLPARASGDPCSLARSWKLTKGLWWKMAAGVLIFLTLLFVVFLLYSGSIGVVIMAIGADTSINNFALLFVTTLLSVPVFLGFMVMIAFVATMICRAYEYAKIRENGV